MRTSTLLVLGLVAACVSAQHNSTAPSSTSHHHHPTPPPRPATTTERDFDAMSLFSLLEEVMNDSGPTAYAYDEPNVASASHDYEDSKETDNEYDRQKTSPNIYDEPKTPAEYGQKQGGHIYNGPQESVPQNYNKQNSNAFGYENQKAGSNRYPERDEPVDYVRQKPAAIPVQEYGQKVTPHVNKGPVIPVQGYVGQKETTQVNKGPIIPVEGYAGQKVTAQVNKGPIIPVHGYVGQKTADHVSEGAKMPPQGYAGQKASVQVEKETKVPVQEFANVKTNAHLNEGPKVNNNVQEKPKTPVATQQESRIAPQANVQQKPAANVRDEPKIALQEHVQQKIANKNIHEEPKVVLRDQAQQKTAAGSNAVEGSKIVAQEYVQQKTSAQISQTNVKPPTNIYLREEIKTTTQRQTEKSTTKKYEEPKTTTPVYVDSEPMPLANYRMPVHYTFNNGQPFYLEKDPVTGDIDFESKKLQLQNIPASPKSDDYFYDEEEIEGDGIDRKDGKILTSHTDKNNPFHNLPLSYNDFKKVNDYSNHNQKYSDFPLISSSYANTKVQGTAGEKIMNHKPYATSSTHSPSYYTIKQKPATTESTSYNDNGSRPVNTPNYGDKIQKRPTQGIVTTNKPSVGDKPSGTDLQNKRPNLHSNVANTGFGSQNNKRPVVDTVSEESSKVQTIYSKRPTEDSFPEKTSGFGSQYNKEPIADRPAVPFGFESPLNKKPTIATSSESYLSNRKTTLKPIPNKTVVLSQSVYTPKETHPSTTQNIPTTDGLTTKTPPPPSSSFVPESNVEENQSEDYDYYDSRPETTATNFVTPQKPQNFVTPQRPQIFNTETYATDKTAPQQFSTSTTDSAVLGHKTEHNTVLSSGSKFNTELTIQHITAQPNRHSNTEPTISAVRPHSGSSGYEVVENVEVEPASSTTSTRRPLIGTIVYAETADKTTTFPSVVYSETATRLPSNVVTSMPLGTSFQFNRPNTGSQFLHPTRQEPKPAGSNFVTNVETNTGGTFINQGGQKESAYGIFGEEPFRPIFGPGDKSAEGLQINPGQNLVVPKIPQETPNRWNYPNAPVNPESFFQMKTEKTEAPPRIPGVEPPFKKPTPFLREPVNSHGNPWGNSQQLFQVSTHVKFPAEAQETTDNIAEEGNTAPPTFNLPSEQRPGVYQTIPQRHYQQPTRGSIPPNRPNGIPDSPPRNHYVGPKRPIDENFDRETGMPTVPSREAIAAQRPGESFPVRGAPVGTFTLVKDTSISQKTTSENSPTRVQGSSVNVALRGDAIPQRPNFPQDQNLNIPIGVNIVNVGAQGPNQPPADVDIAVSGSTTKDDPAIPGEIPNLPLTEMEGSPPFMNEPAGMLQPPRPVWDRPDARPRPNQFYRKPLPPTRRHGANNLPNILPQFRPNAKVSHHEGNRIGYFPQRQPLLERQRPVSEHLIPPPSRLRNRNDNVDELMAYDAYHQSPPGPILRRPFVHRRAGPHVDHHNPRPQTLQMIQQFPRQPQLPRDNLIKDPERPVFVVYPSNPGSKPGNIGKPNPDKEVVVGIRGPHLPVPPANLDTEDDIMSAIPYQHNKNQTPLLQPVKERTDRPMLTMPTVRPVKHDFPYALVEPEENSEDESEEDNAEVAKSSIDETIEAEVYNNHPPNHDDTEINVIPYLQDYMPFATRKPNEPVTVSENQWPFDRKDQVGKIPTKANTTDEHISVTLKTVSASSSPSPIVAYVPTTSSPFRITDYPRPGSTVEKGSAHHKTVVASEGSEFTLSAVMHTIPQSNSEKRKDTPHVAVIHSASPNLHLPQNHNNGENIALSQNFQAPFMASANVGATPLSQGWNILSSSNTDDRMKPGTVDKADLDVRDEDRKETEIAPATKNPNFDFENFKPQLFGGFKPIYTDQEESTAIKRPQTTEREEKKLS